MVSTGNLFPQWALLNRLNRPVRSQPWVTDVADLADRHDSLGFVIHGSGTARAWESPLGPVNGVGGKRRIPSALGSLPSGWASDTCTSW
jgi:hypothetical protein